MNLDSGAKCRTEKIIKFLKLVSNQPSNNICCNFNKRMDL